MATLPSSSHGRLHVTVIVLVPPCNSPHRRRKDLPRELETRLWNSPEQPSPAIFEWNEAWSTRFAGTPLWACLAHRLEALHTAPAPAA